jgi:hypothetical protein
LISIDDPVVQLPSKELSGYLKKSPGLLDGRDLRREPIEERKRLLAKLLRGSKLSISCGLSTRLRGHRVKTSRLIAPADQSNWVKVKNPKAPAVKREAEEDWRR